MCLLVRAVSGSVVSGGQSGGEVLAGWSTGPTVSTVQLAGGGGSTCRSRRVRLRRGRAPGPRAHRDSPWRDLEQINIE